MHKFIKYFTILGTFSTAFINCNTFAESLPPCNSTKFDISKASVGFRCITSGTNLKGEGLNKEPLKYESTVFMRFKSHSGELGWLDEKQRVVFYDRIVAHNGPNGIGELKENEREIFFKRALEKNVYGDTHAIFSYCKDGQTLPSTTHYELAESHGIKEVMNDFKESVFWTTEQGYSFSGEFAPNMPLPRSIISRKARFIDFPRNTLLPIATRCISTNE